MKQVVLCIGICLCDDSLLTRCYILVVNSRNDSAVKAGNAEVNTIHDSGAYNHIDQLLCVISDQIQCILGSFRIIIHQSNDGSFQLASCDQRMCLVHSVIDLEGRGEYIVVHQYIISVNLSGCLCELYALIKICIHLIGCLEILEIRSAVDLFIIKGHEEQTVCHNLYEIRIKLLFEFLCPLQVLCNILRIMEAVYQLIFQIVMPEANKQLVCRFIVKCF